MSAVLPLAVYPYPVSAEAVAAIRAAKEALCARDGLDFKVQICPAVPGSPTRVLSFDGPPPFVADVAKMRDWRDPAELQKWIEWCLDEAIDVKHGFTVAHSLARILPGTVEITDPMILWQTENEIEGRKLEKEMAEAGVGFR